MVPLWQKLITPVVLKTNPYKQFLSHAAYSNYKIAHSHFEINYPVVWIEVRVRRVNDLTVRDFVERVQYSFDQGCIKAFNGEMLCFKLLEAEGYQFLQFIVPDFNVMLLNTKKNYIYFGEGELSQCNFYNGDMSQKLIPIYPIHDFKEAELTEFLIRQLN